MHEEGGGLIHVSISAETLFTIGSFEVTNSMVGAVLASLILLAAARYISRNASIIPGRLQSLIELPIEFMVDIVAGSSTRWRSYVSLIVALFLMILVANWLGLLPGVGTIGIVHEGEEAITPLVRPAAADLNFTLGLAIVAFVVFVWWGIKIHGGFGYLKEIAGQPSYMAPLMFPIHLISELSRIISLSMRLFGNVFAGEVLIATMLALTTAALAVLPLAFFVPAIFLGLELLFGLVQAMVFGLLAMTYISLAIAEHAEGAHGDEHDDQTSTEHDAPAHAGPAAGSTIAPA